MKSYIRRCSCKACRRGYHKVKSQLVRKLRRQGRDLTLLDPDIATDRATAPVAAGYTD